MLEGFRNVSVRATGNGSSRSYRRRAGSALRGKGPRSLKVKEGIAAYLPQGHFRRQLKLKEGVARVLFAPRKLSFNGVSKRLPFLMIDGGRSNIVLQIDQEMR